MRAGMFLDPLESPGKLWTVSRISANFWTLWKISAHFFWKLSEYFGRFPDTLDNLRKLLKVPIQSFEILWNTDRSLKKLSRYYWEIPNNLKKYLDTMESFQYFCKVSRHPVNFSDTLKDFQILQKVSGQSGQFSKHSCWSIWRACSTWGPEVKHKEIPEMFYKTRNKPEELNTTRHAVIWRI